MRLLRAVPLALVLVLCCGAVAGADGGRDHGRSDFAPVHRLGGVSGSELIGEWWARMIEIPNAQNPLGAGTTPMCLDLGRHGRVVAPVGAGGQDATCTVRAGEDVYLQLTSADCSSNEPDPFHGATEAEQRNCAIKLGDDGTGVVVHAVARRRRPRQCAGRALLPGLPADERGL
jgi:hypothetical protein